MANRWNLSKRFAGSYGAISYDVFGQGSPLLMIHGTPFSSYVWRTFVPALADRFTIYVYDLLGYGQSEKRDKQDVSLGVQSHVLAELLDHWALEQPTVVAHDFGGATTLRTHILAGRPFAKMVLVDPVAVAPWGSPFVQHVRRHMQAFEGMPLYIHDGILRAYIQDAAATPLSEESLAAYKAPWSTEEGKRAFYRQIAQMDQKYTDEVESAYPQIQCPVHLFWGEDDTWIPLSRGQKLHSLIPHATLQTIPGAGHLVQEDQPERLLQGLLAVLHQDPTQA